MSTETTTSQTIPGRTGGENNILQALQQLFGGSMEGLGDLSGLAGGDLSALGPTGADQELVQQSIGRTAEMARRALKQELNIGSAGLDESLAARGIQDSSIEGFERAGLQSRAFDQIANMVDQSRQEGSQALMNLPFQRAAVQLNANQQLFNRIMGAGGMVTQQGLQERMAQPTQTTKTPFSAGQALQLGQQLGGIAGAPFTGGASMAAAPLFGNIPGAGTQLFDPRTQNIFTGPTYGR